MRQLIVLLLSVAVLAGCGHSPINHTPTAPQGMTRERAAAVVERGFHEDYGRHKPQSVVVTDKAIVLSDGTVTRGIHSGTAAIPVYGVAVGVGATTATTVQAGQHIYLDSLQPAIVSKKQGRDHRFAVTIRQDPGITVRHVFFRSEQRAREFADALEWLRRSSG